MKIVHPLLAPLAVLVLIGGAAQLASGTSPISGTQPARFVSASITINEKVVLRASTSDDGDPDADEVWNYLVEHLEFQPTEAFSSLGIDPTSDAITFGWLESKENEDRGEPPSIGLEVAYGGRDAPFRLGLVRVAGTKAWRVDRETVERRFPHRRIRRAQAAQLADPKRVK